jgi:hypothetical protein
MLYGQVAQSNSSVRTDLKRIAKKERNMDMALEDFMEPEVAITAAVTAAVFSPGARKIIRRGLVYGIAGVLIAGDAIASVARNVGQGVQQAGAAAVNSAQQTMNSAKTEASSKESTPSTTTTTPRRTTSTKTPSDTVGG